MAAFKPNPINYVLGLDIGIASVGWAMVEIDEEENPIRLIDLGVRVFERAEVPKTGDSLAAARRLARSVRRLTRRRPPPARARGANAQRKVGVLILYVDEDQSPARDGSYQFIAISHGVSKRVRRGAAVAW